MKKIYNTITNIGIQEDISYVEKVRLQIFNQTLFIIFITSALGVFLAKYQNPFEIRKVHWILPAFVFFPIVNFILNYLRFNFASLLFFTIGYPLYLLFYNISYGNETGVGFTFIGFALGILIFYDNWKIVVTNISFVIILMWIGNYYSIHYEPLYPKYINEWNFVRMSTGTLVILTIGISRIFSDIKKHAKELEKNNKSLKKSLIESQRKTELLSIIAHDLRGPFLAFRGMTKKANYLIEREQKDRLFEILKDFDSKGAVLFHNLDNLLSWVIAQKNKLEVNPSEFSLHEVVEQLSENLLLQNKEDSIFIENQVGEDVVLRTDKNMLRIILYNLISNAIKYSSQGDQITIACKYQKEIIEISVADQGNGIPKDILEQIQSGTSYNKITNKGYGLGLNICHSLTSILNGKIIVKSELEKGTQVFITLPR